MSMKMWIFQLYYKSKIISFPVKKIQERFLISTEDYVYGNLF